MGSSAGSSAVGRGYRQQPQVTKLSNVLCCNYLSVFGGRNASLKRRHMVKPLEAPHTISAGKRRMLASSPRAGHYICDGSGWLLKRCLCCRARRYSCCATLIMIWLSLYVYGTSTL